MTIKEIARLAGVSISTVSKIVNNKDENINVETRNRVLKIVKDYNYTPYGTVKTTSEAKTFILGVLLRSIPKTNQFLNGALFAAQKNGYSLLLYDSVGSISSELKNITSLCKNNIDGVIWEPVNEQSLEYRRYFDEQGIEVCSINTGFDTAAYFIDFNQMGYEATQSLIQYGHTKLGCLTKENSVRSDMVFEGFKKCLFDNSLPYHDTMKLSAENQDWYNGILSHTPTGIVSSHYASSLVLLEQLAKIQYRIPYDLSLVSLRDDVRENLRFPGISSIKIPYYEFGAFVCERLIEKCEKKELTANIFQTEYPLENTFSLDVPFSSHAKKIVVVGSINIDVTLNVDELPQPGRTVSTGKHSVILGGKGANQAVGASKLGSEVSLIGKVGNDYDSTIVYTCMEENHVDVQAVRRDPHSETGKAYIYVQNDGESMITILTGANQNLTAGDVLPYHKLFENAGYCLLQTEVPEDAVEAAARLAHSYGVCNILKPAAMNHISDTLMELIDIFVPNRKEAELLCPEVPDIEGKADTFLKKGAKIVIITLGHSGCYIKSPEFTGYLPAADFTPVDTTGAADAFIAALAVYLSSGFPIAKAAKIATYAAGFCVSRQGVIPALIDRNSLETYIKRIEPDIL
ncbi:LacI family transcriptional regulator [Hungatella effluvii]|uniref:Ribokinase n=1 Tax=Hungatella effluvii TaxID=1096246 RepID=A0A2V3XXE8_9FIRM|nr:PfkB family carbohydrate kinase [Hungatella effluvii]PXX48565.1 LacI family transcriptional regulator [Hungatella effluvii]